MLSQVIICIKVGNLNLIDRIRPSLDLKVILTAHQPAYLPWLGLFHKIGLAQTFCVLDTVQFEKDSYINRNKIKTSSGPLWLSVPVETKNHFETKIYDLRIAERQWSRKHFKSIEHAYKKAPFYDDYISQLGEVLLGQKYIFLKDLNHELMKFFLKELKIETAVVFASDYNFVGKKSDLIIDMCKKLGATNFIFGSQGRDYADYNLFQDTQIEISFQNYVHPKYSQLHNNFEPYMSIVDLLFNVGRNAREVIMQGNVARIESEDQAALRISDVL